MFHPTPRDALFAGLGALAFPVVYLTTLRRLGRNILDDSYRARREIP